MGGGVGERRGEGHTVGVVVGGGRGGSGVGGDV